MGWDGCDGGPLANQGNPLLRLRLFGVRPTIHSQQIFAILAGILRNKSRKLSNFYGKSLFTWNTNRPTIPATYEQSRDALNASHVTAWGDMVLKEWDHGGADPPVTTAR